MIYNKKCNTLAKVLHHCLFTLHISDDFENTLGVFSFFLHFFSFAGLMSSAKPAAEKRIFDLQAPEMGRVWQ